jgi:hypothetical protein
MRCGRQTIYAVLAVRYSHHSYNGLQQPCLLYGTATLQYSRLEVDDTVWPHDQLTVRFV